MRTRRRTYCICIVGDMNLTTNLCISAHLPASYRHVEPRCTGAPRRPTTRATISNTAARAQTKVMISPTMMPRSTARAQPTHSRTYSPVTTTNTKGKM